MDPFTGEDTNPVNDSGRQIQCEVFFQSFPVVGWAACSSYVKAISSQGGGRFPWEEQHLVEYTVPSYNIYHNMRSSGKWRPPFYESNEHQRDFVYTVINEDFTSEPLLLYVQTKTAQTLQQG